MIRKILFFACMICITLSARAQTDTYCISSKKLTEMRDQMQNQNTDMQRAYTSLFEILLEKNESGPINDAGCVSQQNLVQICKNIWDTQTDACRTFISNIIKEPQQTNFQPLQYSNIIDKTDFNDIDPAVFREAVNLRITNRGRYKSLPSVLLNTGDTFLTHAKEQQINPFLFVAIAIYESSYGTSDAARKYNNIGGLSDASEKLLSYSTVEDSIKKQAETIRKWGATKTLETLSESGHYCRASAAAQWSTDIASIAKRFYKYYNETLQNKQ